MDDYLALESERKYEYFGGKSTYGLTSEFCTITFQATSSGACTTGYMDALAIRTLRRREFASKLSDETRFYHPDVFVVRRSNGPHERFQEHPTVIFEVLSKKTRRIDEVEKYDAYVTISSLRIYAIVEQELPRIVVHRRTAAGFVREVYDGLDAVLPLPEIETELPLAEVYEGAELTPEPEEEEFR